ncbi:hypothetical protein [Agromyces aerolatus]|uniref:hypothetical protein n=1 Tax=Agromyces sp. LY-1074 TaxID=3074080 RepID=UPI00285BA11C|nr:MULTISPECIES: hypothetical protein [unclassified Agromyces]MDR5701702.1 hypothetical protein [Agromyces sp. LY-1074]MDR5707951.1 hypothetical protein [Agromyces sp. LY-1358]
MVTWIVDPESQVELWVPEYATPESVIVRESMRRDGTLTVVRVFPEWGTESPLWVSGPDDGVIRAEPALSEALRVALQSWVERWRTDFDVFSGWSSAERRESWFREGDLLASRLQQELWDFAEIVPEFRLAAY